MQKVFLVEFDLATKDSDDLGADRFEARFSRDIVRNFGT